MPGHPAARGFRRRRFGAHEPGGAARPGPARPGPARPASARPGPLTGAWSNVEPPHTHTTHTRLHPPVSSSGLCASFRPAAPSRTSPPWLRGVRPAGGGRRGGVIELRSMTLSLRMRCSAASFSAAFLLLLEAPVRQAPSPPAYPPPLPPCRSHASPQPGQPPSPAQAILLARSPACCVRPRAYCCWCCDFNPRTARQGRQEPQACGVCDAATGDLVQQTICCCCCCCCCCCYCCCCCCCILINRYLDLVETQACGVRRVLGDRPLSLSLSLSSSLSL